MDVPARDDSPRNDHSSATEPPDDTVAGGAAHDDTNQPAPTSPSEVHPRVEAPAQRPVPPTHVYGRRPPARAMLGYIKPTLWGLGAIFVVAFLLLNRSSTRINFVLFQADVPLFVALFVMVAVGAVLGAIAGWHRRRSRQPESPTD